MPNPEKNNVSIVFWLAILVWLSFFIASFASFQIIEPTGDSFTRGLNRVGAFLGWQLVAGVYGLIIWLVYRRRDIGRVARWAALIPPAVFTLLLLSILALFIYGNSSRTLPDGNVAPPKPATVPLNSRVYIRQ